MSENTTTLKIRLTHNAICEMEPAVEMADAAGIDDPTLRALLPLKRAIENGRQVKNGVSIELVGAAAIEALRDEARYRAGHLQDQMADAWDHGDRARLIGIRASFLAIVKKCNAALALEQEQPADGPYAADADGRAWRAGYRLAGVDYTARRDNGDGTVSYFFESEELALEVATAAWVAR